MAERNPQTGDNWALRYDCMRFHLPTSFCDLPYMPYEEALRGSHFLTRSELASQVRQYVETFNLNMITSAHIQSTQYDQSAKRWIIKYETSAGQGMAISKHLVLATGFGSQQYNIPQIADSQLYQGVNMHSAQYQDGKQLAEQAKVSGASP